VEFRSSVVAKQKPVAPRVTRRRRLESRRAKGGGNSRATRRGWHRPDGRQYWSWGAGRVTISAFYNLEYFVNRVRNIALFVGFMRQFNTDFPGTTRFLFGPYQFFTKSAKAQEPLVQLIMDIVAVWLS
jgi:hypothetical protein